MADFDLRNPSRDTGGSGAGLIVAGIIILLFIVGMLFVGSPGPVTTEEGDAMPAPAVTTEEAAPATDG